MLWPAPVSFRAQAFIIAAASLAVVCLAAFIVRDVIFATESKLLADSQQLCIAASQELRTQYQERAAYAGDPLKNLPRDAQEISLMGISATVLKAYKGIKGGMFLPETGRITGYTYPTAASGSESELTEIERIFIRSLANRSAGDDAVATQSKWYDRDLIVGAAVRSGGMVLWTMRRVPVLRYPLMGTQRWWLAALVFSTVLGVQESGTGCAIWKTTSPIACPSSAEIWGRLPRPSTAWRNGGRLSKKNFANRTGWPHWVKLWPAWPMKSAIR